MTSAPIGGPLLLAIALVFNAIFLAPELRIDRVPLNDLVFHLAASERLELAVARGEPFLDPWVSEWSRARGAAARPCYVIAKLSWHPDLVASVDGKPAVVFPVTPGFAAFAVPAGDHDVEVRYEPGSAKPVLFVAGLAAFALAASRYAGRAASTTPSSSQRRARSG